MEGKDIGKERGRDRHWSALREKELGLLFKTKQEKDISCNETAVCEE